MAEDKKDSFWDSNNDDFWSKPVVSDDWLKSDNDSFWETDIKVDESTSERSDYTNDVLHEEKVAEEVHYTPQQVQDLLEGKKVKKPVKKVTKSKKLQTVEYNGQKTKTSKKKHIHTKICLVAIGVAILAGVLAVVVSRKNIASAMQDAGCFKGVEQYAENEIILNEHDVLLLDDTAYTIVPEIDNPSFYERVKIVVIYAELFSDYYENSAYDSLKPYVGYETENGREYKTACDSWNTSEYSLENTGFTEKHFLYSSTGKGYDSSGYYYYVVPVDVSEMKIYVETYSYKPHHKTVETIYVKDIQIEDAPDFEDLLSRKVVQ